MYNRQKKKIDRQKSKSFVTSSISPEKKKRKKLNRVCDHISVVYEKKRKEWEIE
jgi:hypothetical protein